MGCGASKDETPPKAGMEKPSPPAEKKEKKKSEPEAPVVASTDPKYIEHHGAFEGVFATVNCGKDKPSLTAVLKQPAGIALGVVHCTGEVFTLTLTEAQLRTLKDEKLPWSSFFKQLKNQLRKATFTAKNSCHILTIPADSKSQSPVDFEMTSQGNNPKLMHEHLLIPLAALFLKFKGSKDDEKVTKLELDTIAKQCTITDCAQKITALQSEVGPLLENAHAAQEDARAAKEQADAVRRRMGKLKAAVSGKVEDPLFQSVLPEVYELHVPQAKENVATPVAGNKWVMRAIREKYGADLGEDCGTPDDANAVAEITGILDTIDEYEFDVWKLKEASGNTPLFHTAYTLMHKHGLVKHFSIDEETLCNFLEAAEAAHHDNPFTNSTHAADVLHSLNYIIDLGNLRQTLKMSQSDTFAAILSAIFRNFDHPGYNNHFHIRTGAYLAILYNDRNILENHALNRGWDLFKTAKYNIFANMTWEQYKDCRDTVVEVVLSSDMGLHHGIYDRFRKAVNGEKEWKTKEDQRLGLTVALKMAEMGQCTKTAKSYQQWSEALKTERYNQGDAEARLGLRVSPFFNRKSETQTWSKGQQVYINDTVLPLWEAGAQLSGKLNFAVDNIKTNLEALQ